MGSLWLCPYHLSSLVLTVIFTNEETGLETWINAHSKMTALSLKFRPLILSLLLTLRISAFLSESREEISLKPLHYPPFSPKTTVRSREPWGKAEHTPHLDRVTTWGHATHSHLTQRARGVSKCDQSLHHSPLQSTTPRSNVQTHTWLLRQVIRPSCKPTKPE